MQRFRLVLFIALVLAAAAFLFRYTFSKARPEIPADTVHLEARNHEEACAGCHGPGGVAPRSRNHPLSRAACANCHYWEGETR